MNIFEHEPCELLRKMKKLNICEHLWRWVGGCRFKASSTLHPKVDKSGRRFKNVALFDHYPTKPMKTHGVQSQIVNGSPVPDEKAHKLVQDWYRTSTKRVGSIKFLPFQPSLFYPSTTRNRTFPDENRTKIGRQRFNDSNDSTAFRGPKTHPFSTRNQRSWILRQRSSQFGSTARRVSLHCALCALAPWLFPRSNGQTGRFSKNLGRNPPQSSRNPA